MEIHRMFRPTPNISKYQLSSLSPDSILVLDASIMFLSCQIPMVHTARQVDLISSLLGGINEFQVTLVEVSHGGNKPAADHGEPLAPSPTCYTLW